MVHGRFFGVFYATPNYGRQHTATTLENDGRGKVKACDTREICYLVRRKTY